MCRQKVCVLNQKLSLPGSSVCAIFKQARVTIQQKENKRNMSLFQGGKKSCILNGYANFSTHNPWSRFKIFIFKRCTVKANQSSSSVHLLPPFYKSRNALPQSMVTWEFPADDETSRVKERLAPSGLCEGPWPVGHEPWQS